MTLSKLFSFLRAFFVVGALGASLAPRLADAQCCGDSVASVVATPMPTQTYRLDFQTVYDEQRMTAYRVSYETVYDARVYTVTKPVWETQTTERRYTVQRPVWETASREERFTVMKPVYETQVRDMSYDVTRDVVETSAREERFTVMKPVYETAIQQQTSLVRRPVYETSEREEAYSVAEQVTTMRTTYADQGGYVDTVTPMVAPGTTQLNWVPSGWAVNPTNGLASWQRGGYAWTVTPGVAMNQVNRVYQPNVVPVQVPETTTVNRVMTRRVPVQTMRYVDEQVVQQVPVQTMRMVAEEQVRQVPVQTVRKIVERVENKVPVQTVRMVAEEQVRQVPVQVCRMVSEERVEPVTTQVCKYVTEQRTTQVPRVVEKRVPYEYTVRSPRTVVMRVPLDSCGNPLPIALAAPQSAGLQSVPVSAARSTATPQVATQSAAAAAPSLSSTDPVAEKAGPTKTYSDKPADVPAKGEEGWKGSGLQHIDPAKTSADPSQSGNGRADAHTDNPIRTQKPAAREGNPRPVDLGADLGTAETIPTPPGTVLPPSLVVPQEPTIAPVGPVRDLQRGPAVEPAPPAADARDVPAAETTGRSSRVEVSHADRST